jgi:hypothetical protein
VELPLKLRIPSVSFALIVCIKHGQLKKVRRLLKGVFVKKVVLLLLRMINVAITPRVKAITKTVEAILNKVAIKVAVEAIKTVLTKGATKVVAEAIKTVHNKVVASIVHRVGAMATVHKAEAMATVHKVGAMATVHKVGASIVAEAAVVLLLVACLWNLKFWQKLKNAIERVCLCRTPIFTPSWVKS